MQERWDIALASCKGYSVRAARTRIAEQHCKHCVPVLDVHDFDQQGIGIFDTSAAATT